MKPPYQVPLAIDRPLQQRLDNFVVGANGELLALLSGPAEFRHSLWLAGPPKSGKSHLLRGVCGHQAAHGEKVAYVDGKLGIDRGLTSLQYALDQQLSVCVDDVAVFAGEMAAEEMLLALYQTALTQGRLFIASHTVAAAGLEFALPDLNSRMRSLQHFIVQPLADTDKAELLRSRAARRGYTINQAVLNYWLARAPRDTGTLITDLDVLDRATLARKQTVTIPLLKQVLGY